MDNEIRQNKNLKKKIFIALSVFIAILIICVVIILILNSPTRKLKIALEENNYDKALEICIEDNSEKTSKIVIEYIERYVDDYANGYIEYETVSNILETFSGLVDIGEKIELIDKIQTSKINRNNATHYIATQDYMNAINCLEKVIEEDIENYNQSLEKIDEVLELQLSKAEKLLKEKEYDLAYNAVIQIEKYEQVKAEARDMKNRISTECSNELLSETQKLYNNGKYLEAYNFVDKINVRYLNEELKTAKKNSMEKYVSSQLSTAKNEYDSENYDKAINILTNANSNMPDNRFTDKISEYKKNRNSQVISKYKSKVICKYDSIDKTYKIVSKGLSADYITINYNRNIQADISLSNITTGFYLYLGFQNDSWIFMEKIIIDCDGKQYTISVDYWDRITDVSGGDIREAYGIIHGTNGYDHFMNLEPVINSMINAEVVTVRFDGDGKIDKVIPKKHINEIDILWQIYNVLKDNPELISEL